ncbi:transposase [Fortiea contorta]|uniref:IS110 family transposase n=1 Tax=Fortiea contorta TaxID=1892405 RepID=UPI000345459B|nr:transposase [Fortiea contorta]
MKLIECYYQCSFDHFSSDIAGIKALLAIQPDIAVVEPTGVNYSKIWIHHLTRIGVEIRFVGHKELRNYRMHQLGLPDKDDDGDSLALACYYFDYQNSPWRFLKIRDPLASQIREMVLRLAHLNRVRSPIVNRTRQDLAWQFPEIALRRSVIGRQGTIPLLWGWLAEQRISKKYDDLYKNTAGLGITNTVRYHARRLCSLYEEEIEIEAQLKQLLQHPNFAKYLAVFEQFQFGQRLQAWLISQLFPFETFLENNQPIVIERRGRFSGKPTKRHLSLRKFQKTLGVAPSAESSGDIHRQKVTDGSSVCRKALWQWVFTAIEPRTKRPKNQIGKFLGDYLDSQKALGIPVQLVRSRTAVKGVKLLFGELVREFCK